LRQFTLQTVTQFKIIQILDCIMLLKEMIEALKIKFISTDGLLKTKIMSFYVIINVSKIIYEISFQLYFQSLSRKKYSMLK
jgi:hypothetical protein